MINSLIPGEEELFFLINGSHNPFLDCVMWVFSLIKIWTPLAIFVILNIVYKKSWKQYLPTLLFLVLLFVVCDQFSSHLIKPLAARPRPTHYPGIMEDVRTLFNYTGGKFGFISGHATNSFGFAMFSTLLFRNKFFGIIVFAWASVVGYSRIYLGVHFVSDVIGGMIAGIIVGFFIYKLYHLFQKKSLTLTNNIYSTKRVNIMSAVMVCYIIIFSILSEYIVDFFINTK